MADELSNAPLRAALLLLAIPIPIPDMFDARGGLGIQKISGHVGPICHPSLHAIVARSAWSLNTPPAILSARRRAPRRIDRAPGIFYHGWRPPRSTGPVLS